MTIDIYIILASVVLFSFISVAILTKISSKIGFEAIPNSRSMHKIATPSSGGIAIFLSFLLGTLFLDKTFDIFTYIAFILVFSLGLFDDLKGANSKVKFLWLALAGTLLFFNGYEIHYLGNFFGLEVNVYGIIAYLVFLVAFIGFINAMNLIDGLDGLASLVGIVMLLAYAYLGYKHQDSFLLEISILYIMALMGFLFFNWNPAKIFMGDSGSLVLGLIIVVLSIYIIQKHYITPISVLLLSAVPILDTLIVMIRRISQGKNPFHADKTHIHHLIYRQQRGNVKRTVVLLALIQMTFTYIGLGLKVKDDMIILVAFLLLFFIFYTIFTPKQQKNKL